jgi:hypothetical protein
LKLVALTACVLRRASGFAKLDDDLGSGFLGRIVQRGLQQGSWLLGRLKCANRRRTGLLVPPCRYTYCLWGGLIPVPADDAISMNDEPNPD